MTGEASHGEIWDDLVEDLCDAARYFAGSCISGELYRNCIVEFTAKRMERHHCELLSQLGSDGKIWFNVCALREDVIFATVKADPFTGRVTIQ
jgi:hypothetical protein